MTHLHDYHRALEKITRAPLTLTDADFLVLEEYGGSRDERRGRDALQQAQLAILPPAEPIQTKAIEPPPPRVGLRPEVLGTMLGQALRPVLTDERAARVALVKKFAELEQRVVALERRDKERTETLPKLQEEVRALGQLWADQHPVPSREDRSASPSRPIKH